MKTAGLVLMAIGAALAAVTILWSAGVFQRRRRSEEEERERTGR